MWLLVNDCAFHYKYKKQWGHSQDKETLRLWELKENDLKFCRVMSTCCSLLQFKAQQQLSDFQTPSHIWLQDSSRQNLPFQLKANAGPKRCNRDGHLEDPKILNSRNVAFHVFLGEVVRNTGSSLSEISPWGNKCTVNSYLPENTRKRPSMN